MNQSDFKAGEAKGKEQEKANQVIGEVKDTAQSATDSCKETGQQMQGKAGGAAEAVKDSLGMNK